VLFMCIVSIDKCAVQSRHGKASGIPFINIIAVTIEYKRHDSPKAVGEDKCSGRAQTMTMVLLRSKRCEGGVPPWSWSPRQKSLVSAAA